MTSLLISLSLFSPTCHPPTIPWAGGHCKLHTANPITSFLCLIFLCFPIPPGQFPNSIAELPELSRSGAQWPLQCLSCHFYHCTTSAPTTLTSSPLPRLVLLPQMATFSVFTYHLINHNIWRGHGRLIISSYWWQNEAWPRHLPKVTPMLSKQPHVTLGHSDSETLSVPHVSLLPY